jgi:hypothetical protein
MRGGIITDNILDLLSILILLLFSHFSFTTNLSEEYAKLFAALYVPVTLVVHYPIAHSQSN